MKRLLRFSALPLAVFWLIVPASAQSQPRALEPYKIGATIPLTGAYAANSAEYIAGAQVAVDGLNKAGGVNGHPLQIVIEDTQGTPEGGVAAMRKLVEVDHVPVILTLFTNVVTAQMPLADQLKIPLLNTVETPGLMVRAQYAFAASARYSLVAPLLQRYWKAHHVKRVFAFLGNNSQGVIYSPLVRATATAAGAEYQEALINLTDTDFRGVVTRAKDFNPDAVFFEVSGSQAETLALRQVREAGITAQFYEDSNFFQTKTWRLAVGDYVEGMIFGGLVIDESKPSVREFAQAFRAKTGSDPGYVSGEFYDMARMVAFAMKTGGYNGEAIRNVLANLKGFPSVFGGTIAMGDDRYTVITSETLMQVVKGHEAPIPIPK